MADMELLITIPEELKNKIDNANEDNYRTYLWWFETTLYCAIKEGTILPKGHGRLFDERDIVNGNYEIIGNKIYEAEPIIEADKVECEGK